MSFAVVALGLGLVLLVVAASLFLRASQRGTSDAQTSQLVQAEGQVAVEKKAGGDDGDGGISDDSADGEAVSEPAVVASVVAKGRDAAAGEISAPLPSFGGRRGRRHWASAHGCEYAKEDLFLSAEWPVSLVRELSPGNSSPVAREVVSGFLDGHQLHIAEVSGSTVFALRRGAYSPVDVHMSTSAAMPAGMRHDSSLDRGVFTIYTSDPRAMARMLDSRVEKALAGLTGVVRDIALSGAWVVIRCVRRLDPSRWDSMLPHLLALDATSRTLPPMVTTAILDMSLADPTRPRPGSGVRVAAPGRIPGHNTDNTGGTDSTGGLARPGYVRAVPDAPSALAGSGSSAGVDGPGEPGGGELESTEDLAGRRPSVERPATPVDFPTRSHRQVLGDADLDGIWPEDVADDGLTTIPALGEEPSPQSASRAGDPRIVRTGDSATIFTDALGEDDSIGDLHEDGPATVAGTVADHEVVDPED